ncbi:hypothetical protein [Parasedimentitalea denitrificans]|uniref:hypothetical protein n=1 Tax=Parasedimentitalea denitrificans TaxID=2211118 RepID=UPI00143048A1|nr:hypothetical protein [Sedimentitalea sp. CY04]
MSKMTTPAAALLSLVLLTSCEGSAVHPNKIPPEILNPAPKPALPPVGASNSQMARYILATEEWMDGAISQIGTLAKIICTFTRQKCPADMSQGTLALGDAVK